MRIARFDRVSRAVRRGALFFTLVWPATPALGQGGLGVCFPGSNPLQAAIDAAQAGDAIDVGAYPNLGQRVCVTKPLLFFSTTTPPATITATSDSLSNAPRGVFHIVSGVSGVVAFHNLQIQGVTCYSGPDGVMRGIYSQSPSVTVLVDGCSVSGADYGCGIGDGFADGAAGIEGAVARLVVKDSQVSGGDGDLSFWRSPWSGSLFCYGGAMAGSGGDAIDVTGEVLIVRSVLTGGNGGDAVGSYLATCGCAPPVPSYAVPGSGGSAVVAPIVWSWGSTGTPGAGGLVTCGIDVYGYGPAGAALPPGGVSTLQVGPQPTLGGSAVMSVVTFQSAAIGVGTSGFGSSVQIPGLGPYFLGPSPIVFPGAPPPAVNSIPIPADPSLVGLAFPVQAGVQNGGGFVLSNPDFVLILP